MKIIKEGKPYRKHKCSGCGCIYVYHIFNDTDFMHDIRCPECKICDFKGSIFDKKLTKKEADKLRECNGEETNNS